jgi:hypothetical protein
MDVGKVSAFVRSALKKHQAALRDIATHQTAVLELAAFVATYEHYRLAMMGVRMVHPTAGALTIKTTTRGHPAKFTRIEVSHGAANWEVHMNLPVRGAYGDGIFCVDVAVVKSGAVPRDTKKSGTLPKWLACANQDLISFAEVKKLVIYPMLLAQFVGIVHEILPRFLLGRRPRGFKVCKHFEPALLALGN